MFKKILIGVFVFLLVVGFAQATFRREVYDYQGSWARQKINYSLFEAKNISGTEYVCVAGVCRNTWPSGAGADLTNVAFTNESETWETGLNISMGSGGWFKGLFNWIINAIGPSTSYLSFNGSDLTFSETYLNETIRKEGVRVGFNSTYNTTYHGQIGRIDVINQTIIDSNASWLSTFNQTYDNYATNVSFGDIFVNESGDTMSGPLTIDKVSGKHALNVVGNVNITGNLTVGGASAYYRTYDTGWILRNDWTNVYLGSDDTQDTNSNVTHGLNAPLSELTVKVLVSSDGTDNNSMEIIDIVKNFATDAANHYGIVVYQYDSNNIEVLTGKDGVIRLLPGASYSTLDTDDFYYKIVVSRIIMLDTTPLFGGTPAGAVMAFNSVTCPDGWIFADGSSGTPDLRGIFIRGAGISTSYQMANGTFFNSPFGTFLIDSFQSHYHELRKKSDGYYTDPILDRVGAAGTLQRIRTRETEESDSYQAKDIITAGAEYGTPRIGAETRPASYALTYCVKTTEDTVTSNTIWGTSGNDIVPNDVTKNLRLFQNLSVDGFVVGDLNITGNVNVTKNATIGGNLGLNIQNITCKNGEACDWDTNINRVGAVCPTGYITTGCSNHCRDSNEIDYCRTWYKNETTCMSECKDGGGNQCTYNWVNLWCMRITDIGDA